MHTCILCRKKFESEEPAILFVNKYGYPRELCPECEKLLDTATGSDPEKAEESKKIILDYAKDLKEKAAMEVLCQVLNGEASPEETEEDEAIEESYDEIKMTEEEKEEEKKEEEIQRKKDNSFLSWLPLIIAGVLFIAFLVWWFGFR